MKKSTLCCCKKNLNSLLKDKNKCSEHFCINCFKKFRTKSKLEKHYQEDC